MKKLSRLKSVKTMTKNEQQSVLGGWDSNFCIRFCPGADSSDWRYFACRCNK